MEALEGMETEIPLSRSSKLSILYTRSSLTDSDNLQAGMCVVSGSIVTAAEGIPHAPRHAMPRHATPRSVPVSLPSRLQGTRAMREEE